MQDFVSHHQEAKLFSWRSHVCAIKFQRTILKSPVEGLLRQSIQIGNKLDSTQLIYSYLLLIIV